MVLLLVTLTPNSVILWTRISPRIESDASNVTVEGTVPLYNHDTEVYIEKSAQPVCVEWRVSTAKDLSSPAASGKAHTSSDIDFTIKVTDIWLLSQYPSPSN